MSLAAVKPKRNKRATVSSTAPPPQSQITLYNPQQQNNNNFTTEFKNYEDDAWYTVSVTFEEQNDTLRVTFEKSTDDVDQLFKPSFLGSFEDIHEFEKRFRPVSVPVQDDECGKVVKDVKVCAAYLFSDDDLRFYDAVVHKVQECKHSRKKDADCLCTFKLSWLHGPNAGKYSTAKIGDICFVQPITELNPAVASFLEIARRRIESQSGKEIVAYCHKGIETADQSGKTNNKMGYFERMQKGRRRAKRSVLGACSPEVSLEGRMEDKELEGKRNVCMIVIGNLDKELSPSTAVEFLNKHTRVTASVFIFPSLSSEVYTKGAIMLNTEKDLQKLCDFLTNPNHIITSSTGRPWVVIDKQVGLKNIKASIGTLLPNSQDGLQNGKNRKGNNLKVVSSGTQEFKLASCMRTLFIEFADHQVRLHKKLAFMEGNIKI